MSKYYTFIGNINHIDYESDVLHNYELKKKQEHKEFNKCKFVDLNDVLKYIIFNASNSLDKQNHLLNNNPDIIVERHHSILQKDKKVKHRFGIHTDREGPASGPCYSILYYYHIDPVVKKGDLHFYDDEYACENEPMETFRPVSGDIVAFHDGIYHCPDEYYTDSIEPCIRGLLAIFIKI